MYLRCSIFALVLGFALQNGMPDDLRRKADEDRQRALKINELAGQIKSQADAEALVNEVAAVFEKELPPAWATGSIREQLARAEFKSATDSAALIPEQRIAEVWNTYAREIQAPEETIVTVAEIHNLRDALYASDRMLWDQNLSQTVWTLPNIVALGPDGKVASGCRALETLRLMASMNLSFENVRSTRKRLQAGIVTSEEMAKRAAGSAARQTFSVGLTTSFNTNPLWPAQDRYIREHGRERFELLLAGLLGRLLE